MRTGIATVRRWLRRARRAAGACMLYKNPFPRFLDYLGVLKPGQRRRTRLRNGLTVTVRTGGVDFGVIDEIFLHGVYDKALRRLHRGDNVVDIGAQAGFFALAAAVRGATVLCVEPLQDNLAVLIDNAESNRLQDRITALNFAVAGNAGKKDLHVVAADTGGATFFPSIRPIWGKGVEMSKVTVQCVTLAEILAQRGTATCDCVKLDCEGAEFEILAQAHSDDLRRIQMLIMEYHPNGEIRLVQNRLESLGFEVDVSDNPCILFATQIRPS